MSLPDFENFLLVPPSEKFPKELLYILTPAKTGGKNRFVIIPYQNPQVEKIKPKYFKIDGMIATGVNPFDLPVQKPPVIILQAKTSKEKYIKNIWKLKEHIQRGNIYEINYCIEFFANEVTIDPVRVFSKLRDLAKAPYSFLLRLEDEFVICASPELFLKKEGKTLSTKPIKGTIRRSKDLAEDEKLKEELYTNLKERTENVMAVDVARNDLSHFAEKGSVQVNKLYNIETFETVHQMVSTVSCQVKEGTSFETIIESTFPMASMTGAPKLRAMTLIDEFEDFERNYYSGTMGIIDEFDDFTFPVIIRSIFYNQKTKRLSIAVGGAITYLSDPEKEYEECLLKAGTMLKALNAVLSG
jgi:para-aminobenzoate synthetase component I